MADGATEANGASGGGDLRASILSELSSAAKDDTPDEVEASSDEETGAQDEAVEDETLEAGAEDSDDDNVSPDDAEDDPDVSPDEDEEVVTDPKVAKGLDQVRRAEKHARAKLEADRHAFEQEREQHKAALAEVEQVKALARKAKYDPVAVLRALGLEDDDFEVAAHAIYAESKAGAADPNRKAAAQARLREREKEDKLSATDKRIAELEAKIEADKAERAAAVEAQQFLATMNVCINKSPLVKHLWKTDDEATTIGLQHAAERLTKAGKPVTPQAMVAEYERRERARLEKLGLDVTKFSAPAKAAKPGTAPVVAADKKPANTNGTAKKAPSRDEIVAELAKLKS